MKTVVIINGVMGVIGSPIFSYFAEQGENIVWGVSRKGLYFEEFLDADGKIQQKNLVFSLADYKTENYNIDIENFIEALPDLPVVFIHAMGEFVTEMSRDGKLNVLNDHDGDGINDNVKRLTHEVPISFAKKLSARKNETLFIQIGSLSDKYRVDIHGSWLKSMDLLKNDLKDICEKSTNFNATILNVSSVLTPKELIDRPFVSIQTNADMRYWLPPVEIAGFIDSYMKSPKHGFTEEELYKKWPNIASHHFQLDAYKMRRSSELYDNLAQQHGDVLNLENGDSISYSFNNPFHMDRLWGDLTVLLSRNHDKKQPVLFYNPHNWFFVVRGKTEHEIFSSIQNEGGIVYLTCGNNSKLDIDILKKEFDNYNHKYAIATNLGFENNFNLNIYGNFIIEVVFDKETANMIDEFYDKYKEITPENIVELKKIVSHDGQNKLTIYKDEEKANKLRNVLMSNFN